MVLCASSNRKLLIFQQPKTSVLAANDVYYFTTRDIDCFIETSNGHVEAVTSVKFITQFSEKQMNHNTLYSSFMGFLTILKKRC